MTSREEPRSKPITPTPHDAAFKQFLTHPATAHDFIELHLPSALLALCDLKTLRLESGSFIEESLRPYFSDVLYSLKTTAGKGYIHVLIEHQSTPDRHMAALTLLQKHIYQRDLAELLDRLALLLVTEPMTGQQLVSLINYLVQAGETSNAEAFVRDLAQRVPQYEDKLMTIAQQLEQKGMEKGMQLGMEKGERETTLKIARSMLLNGIERDTVMQVTGLSAEEVAQLCH